MNWGHYKDPVCFLFLAGVVVSSLKQKAAGLNNFLKYNIFVTEFAEFSENI